MTLLLTLHVIITLALIGIILIQKSDGGNALMGSGGSGNLFTTRGVTNILTRTTAILATLFIGNCILMSVVSSQKAKKENSIIGTVSTPDVQKNEPEQKPEAQK